MPLRRNIHIWCSVNTNKLSLPVVWSRLALQRLMAVTWGLHFSNSAYSLLTEFYKLLPLVNMVAPTPSVSVREMQKHTHTHTLHRTYHYQHSYQNTVSVPHLLHLRALFIPPHTHILQGSQPVKGHLWVRALSGHRGSCPQPNKTLSICLHNAAWVRSVRRTGTAGYQVLSKGGSLWYFNWDRPRTVFRDVLLLGVHGYFSRVERPINPHGSGTFSEIIKRFPKGSCN